MSIGNKYTTTPITGSGNIVPVGSIPGISNVHDGLSANDMRLIDPDDLRPAERFLGQFLKQELARHPGTPNKPTVILFGELHNTPAHQILQASAVNYIISCEKRRDSGLVFTCERMYDSLQNMANLHLLRVPKRLYWQLNAFDPDNTAALAGLCSDIPDHSEKLGNRKLYTKLLFENVPTLFNDAARASDSAAQENIINPEDPMMHEAWNTCTQDYMPSDPEADFYELTQPDGITLRNYIMCKRAMTYMREKGASVIFQNCGRGHVFGESNSNTYQNSLAALYNHAGCHVVPVLFVNDDEYADPDHTIKRQALELHPETAIVRNIRGAGTTKSKLELAQELAYMRKITTSDGIGEHQSSINGASVTQQHARQQLESTINKAKQHSPGLLSNLRRGISGSAASRLG